MFMLRNVGKYLFGDTSKESIIEIPQGQLFLVRPHSPKGYSELIFKDCAASIRRTAQEFNYQLVIQRAYEEGEEELAADEAGEDDLDGLADKDEKTFLLDEALHFRMTTRDEGDLVFAWRDLSGDIGDLFEFVCDEKTQGNLGGTFEIAAMQCQYERKYRKSHETATERTLHEFSFSDERVPKATSPITTDVKAEEQIPATPQPKAKAIVPKTPQPPPSGDVLARESAELHVFDVETGTFVLQDDSVVVTAYESGTWQYRLQINGKDREWLGQDIIADINPVFNFEYLSFIFNHYDATGDPSSWLLRVRDQPTLERIQEGVMQALWEQLNEMKWAKATQTDKDYVLEAFNDLNMDDAPEEEEEEESDEAPEPASDKEDGYDSDESQENEASQKSTEQNSQLAVGHSNDRSFVVRGSQIGVFRHGNDDKIKFDTNISKVMTPKGKLFSPKKVMLHAKDRNMVLQNVDDPNSVYQMDLEYGKIVDEWKVHDSIPITGFAPENKFAQSTDEQTFLGLSHNALYRVDPRLAGNKLVDSQLKQYASKNDFSALASTERGHIAVASNKGDIRLFDRLGINAKTHIPALGEPIIGLDVSADGKYILATCRTYLLLIDSEQKEGKNKGKLGFEKSFAASSKPQPKRLTLSPEHLAQIQHETKTPLGFTPARFNTGRDINETSIITATGPFVVTWSLQKVLQNKRAAYSIKRYSEEVKADNFRFGSDKNLIVALPNEVDMVAKKALLKPTRESIGLVQTPRRQSSRLRKSDVVNSPY